MTEPTHRSARRVQQLLAAAGCEGRVRELDESTRTSAEAAAALGVGVGQIAKTVVFLADGAPVVVVASGGDRVDEGRVGAVLGAAGVRRADADAVRAATGYPVGGVSPVGLPPGVTVLVDRSLGAYDRLWAAAGTPRSVFPTTFDELLRLSGGRAEDVREDG